MQSTRSTKDTSVKFFTSEMVGAPSLTQVAGALIDVLSACLVHGCGMQQVSSFTVTAGVGQITVPAATGWERMCVIDVAGCADASYNGEYKLSAVTTDGLRVSFPIDAPDGAVLGAAITVKLAGAGWLLRFADPAASKAVFMPGTPQWAGHCLRVEDAAGTHANVRGYETMSGVDDGLGAFPSVGSVPVATWFKAFSGSRPARWLVAADERLVYAGLAAAYPQSVSNVALMMRWFGRFDALTAQDMHAVTLSVQTSAASSGAIVATGCASASAISAQNSICAARSQDGAAAAVSGFVSPLYPYSVDSGSDSACGPGEGLNVGELVFAQKFFRHASSTYPRARMPAIAHAMHTSMSSSVSDGVVLNVGGRLHRFFSGPQLGNGSAGSGRFCAIDIEGPWS